MTIERIRIFRGGEELNVNSIEVTITDNQIIDNAKFKMIKNSNVTNGSVIDFKKADGVTSFFSGKVINKEQEGPWVIPVKTNGYELNNRQVQQVYSNTTPEAIVEDIITNHTTNLTFASSEVSGFTIGVNTPYVANGYAIDIIKEVNVMGWQLRIDESDNVFFEPKGFIDNGKTLTHGINIQLKKWREDGTEMFNQIRIVGGLTNAKADEETFSGDASEKTFTLTKKPVGDIQVTVGGTFQTAGVDGSGDYKVDNEQKKIIFTTAPGIGVDNIAVNYNHQIRVVVEDQDDDSITDNGFQIFKKIDRPSITNFDDARAMAKALLGEFSSIPLSPQGTIPFIDFDRSVGEIITVVDNTRGITEQSIIRRIVYKDNKTELTFGRIPYNFDDLQEEIKERIKTLERRTTDDEVQAFARTSKHKLRARLTVRESQRAQNMNDSFILGHTTLGRLRTTINFEADCSNNSNHGTWQGSDIDGAQYDNLGFRLSKGAFNGSDNFIEVTDDSDLDLNNDFAIALAIRVETLPSALTYVLNKWDGTDGYAVRINSSNKLELIYSNSGSDSIITATTALTAKSFQHVVFVKSGTALTVYINNISDNTGTGDANAGINTEDLQIGKWSTNFFTGSLDEVRIYNNDISAATISRAFNLSDVMASDEATLFTDLKCYLSMDNPRLGDRRGGRMGLDTDALVEKFISDDFKESPTTADWNTTLRRLAMSDSSNQMVGYNTVATSKANSLVNIGRRSFNTITLTADETIFAGDQVVYQLSINGSAWETVSLSSPKTLDTIENKIYWRVIFLGNGANETYIENLKMAYALV